MTRRAHSRGLILALTILMSAAMFFFALMYLNLFRAERQLVGRGEADLIAWEAASAGIQAGALQLKASSLWNAGFSSVSLPGSGATYTVAFTSSGGAPYSTNNSQNKSPVTGWGGRAVPAGSVHLVSVGKVGTTTAIDQALVVPAQAPFGLALFGDNALTLGSYAVIDGYDSAAGPYPGSATGGNVGTNMTAAGKITLNANSVVKGNVQVGVGGTSSVISGTGSYQGLVVPTTTWPNSAVSAPFKVGRKSVSTGSSTTLAPGAYKDINVGNGETLVLRAGTYVIRKLNMGSDAKIVLTSGPVDWWFTGDQSIGTNCQINVDGVTKNFNLRANSTPLKRISFGTGSKGALTLYAPFCTLNVAVGCDLYGSFMAKTITVANGTSSSYAKIHADSALTGQSVSFNILTQW